MKKLLLFFVPGLATYLFIPVFPILAQEKINPCDAPANPIATAICTLSNKDFGLVVQNIVIIIVVLAVIIALLYLLYGGIKWIMSRGDKTEVEAARSHVTAAVIGLVVVFLAVFLVTIVLGVFDVKLGDLKIPSITGSSCTNPWMTNGICGSLGCGAGQKPQTRLCPGPVVENRCIPC